VREGESGEGNQLVGAAPHGLRQAVGASDDEGRVRGVAHPAGEQDGEPLRGDRPPLLVEGVDPVGGRFLGGQGRQGRDEDGQEEKEGKEAEDGRTRLVHPL